MSRQGRISAGAAALALAALTFIAVPLSAETPAQLDALSRASDQAGSGIALARQQMNKGDLLEALGTVERVLLNHPDNDEARLFHAALVCRLDDRRGARIELDALRGHDLPEDQWQEARAACSSGQEG